MNRLLQIHTIPCLSGRLNLPAAPPRAAFLCFFLYNFQQKTSYAICGRLFLTFAFTYISSLKSTYCNTGPYPCEMKIRYTLNWFQLQNTSPNNRHFCLKAIMMTGTVPSDAQNVTPPVGIPVELKDCAAPYPVVQW